MRAKRVGNSEHRSFVMVGHVDHGKSTLIGRILYDTGSLTTDKIAELDRLAGPNGKKDFSLLLDHLEEERRDTMTLDTTQVFFETAERSYTLVDAPGHVELMKNMITGAASAAAAVLVVDVARGPEAQTLRHAQTLDLLKLAPVFVVVNKMDAMGYSEKKFQNVADAIRGLFARLSIKLSDCIPVSAAEGDNVVTRSGRMPWYQGPTLLEALESLEPEKALRDDGSFIFPVQDVFKDHGRTVLLGRVENGAIRQGNAIKILPADRAARVIALLCFGKMLSEVSQGQSIGVVLEDAGLVRRGDILCGPEAGAISVKHFAAKVLCFSKDGLKKGEQLTLRCATQEIPALVESIRTCINPETLASGPSGGDRLGTLEMGEVLFRTDQPAVIAPFALLPALGRFVLYREDVFHAVGLISEVLSDPKN